MTKDEKANRLIREKSPYLLQHAHNPVDWYPWGDEAFERARQEDKPVFLSIGYSTCHWCHVMEKESFEDMEVAEALNGNFIAIKVDREERPDIDSIYMSFCQLMTGRGGWPLTVVLTPDKKPIYAATYIPKLPKYGYAGLLQLLEQITSAWQDQREEITASGATVFDALKKAEAASGRGIITADIADRTFGILEKSFDPIFGGFGREPKFPAPHNLFFLLRYHLTSGNNRALQMAEKTLDGMHRGGIFDHIGYGFSRYSTDGKWLVPHFEKMLYDNALLALAYTEAYAVTGKAQYKEIAVKVLEYALRDMADPGGGFYSAEDADSEGEEGKFYLFKPDEIKAVLGEKAELFNEHYNITESGNFEGASIPNLIGGYAGSLGSDDALSKELESCRQKIMEYRSQRVRPFRDDKILTAWNGMMISALAFAGRIMGDDDYIEAAANAARSVMSRATGENGRLQARFRDGDAAIPGYIDDYAYMIGGLIELYESTLDQVWLEQARFYAREMIRLFWDNEKGGFFLYGKDGEELILRPKEIFDGAAPCGNSTAAMALMRLAVLVEDEVFAEKSHKLLRSFGARISRNPTAHIHFVTAYLCAQTGITGIVVSGGMDDPQTRQMLKEVRSAFYPFAVYRHEEDNAGDKAVAIICRQHACTSPITNAVEFKRMLDIRR